MAVLKLETVDAFVIRDLGDEVPALGIVRSAPKILQSGAKELARTQTYQCALFNMRCQGASAGINATPESRDSAVASFVEELLPLASTGALMLDPAKGIPAGSLDGLFDADPRDGAHRRIIGGLTNAQHLTGLGAAVAADAAVGLDGKRVAIEAYESTGPAVARAASERGASVTAISTSGGTLVNEAGFDITALEEALDAHGADMVGQLGGEPAAAWGVLGADVDVLFAGSKMGLISHQNAPNVTASLLAATGPIPYTTKGALMLEANGTTVLPDMVTTAGAMFASMPPGEPDQSSIEASVVDLLTTLTGQIVGQEAMPVLETCYRAEAFMQTWLDELPFGRPFAA